MATPWTNVVSMVYATCLSLMPKPLPVICPSVLTFSWHKSKAKRFRDDARGTELKRLDINEPPAR